MRWVTTAAQDWEWWWAPYDEPTYQAVLARVRPHDVVLEIGAGDLRLARRLAGRARHVYAFEMQAVLIERALAGPGPAPANLYAVCADARHAHFPPDVTVGVLLMRHCRHFQLYADKLVAIGCGRLITNARWRSRVECVDLLEARLPFDRVMLVWDGGFCSWPARTVDAGPGSQRARGRGLSEL